MRLLFTAFGWFFITCSCILGLAGGYLASAGDFTLAKDITPGIERAVAFVQLKSSVCLAMTCGKTMPDSDVLGAAEVLPETTAENNQATALGKLLQDGEASTKPLEQIIAVGDARPQIVAAFLERYNSPLQPYDQWGTFFVDLADRYEFDFRLLPAISMQESGLCKTTPPNSHNCLGLGVHARGTWEFDSYEANFEAAAKILKKNYIDIGLTTPVEIMSKYTPSSNGSWASSVNQWFAEMRYNDRKLGRERKTDTSVLEFAQASPDAETESPSTPGQ